MSYRSLCFLISALAALAGAIAGCTDTAVTELRRLPSPDGRAEVFVTESNGGATTPFVYRVYVGPPGAGKDDGKEVWRADRVEGLDVVWAGDQLVEIRYGKARMFTFTNFVSTRDLDLFKYVVEVRLRPTSERAL